MIENPILSKLPLVQVKQAKVCGFDKVQVGELLDIQFESSATVGTCQSSMKCS